MKPNFKVLFFAIITLQLITDLYVISKWNKFSKRKNWEKWTRILPYIISFLMLSASIYSNYSRIIHQSSNSKLIYSLFYISSFWFLPKLVLAIVFLVTDVLKSPFKIYNRYFKKKEVQSEIAPNEVQTKKRELIGYAGLAASTIPFIMVYKGLKATYELVINKINLEINNLPNEFDGFTFAQISDLHAGSFPDDKFIQEIIFKTNLLKPDLILFTGDFVNTYPDELIPYAKTLSKFKSEFGTIACLGNHDHYMTDENLDELKGIVKQMNYRLLVNESEQIKIGSSLINIIGVDNSGMNQKFADFQSAYSKVEIGHPNILLCHDPTNWDKSIKNKINADITLSGHTHGGQFAPSLFGYRLEPASYIYKQYAGMYSEKDQHLYVNVGLGTVGPPIRLGVPPEITLFTLRKAQNLA